MGMKENHIPSMNKRLHSRLSNVERIGDKINALIEAAMVGN